MKSFLEKEVKFAMYKHRNYCPIPYRSEGQILGTPHAYKNSRAVGYVTATGNPCVDLHCNIVSEERTKVMYEYLCRRSEDKRVRKTIDFPLNREKSHNMYLSLYP